MKKSQKNWIIIGVILISFAGIFISVYPFAIDWTGTAGEGELPEPPPIPTPPVPDAPTLNDIISTDVGTIELTWNDVSDALYYEVHRSRDGGAYIKVESFVYVNYFINIIVLDGTYDYKIKAGNDGGTSDFSNEESIVVSFPIKPVEPTLDVILPETSSDGVVSLSWDIVSGATYYDIYRSYLGGSYELIDTINNNYYSDLTIDDGIYSYKIKAGNSVGTSDYSNTQSTVVVIIEEPPPLPPLLPDYTIIYILLGVLGGVVIIAVFLTRKKKKT